MDTASKLVKGITELLQSGSEGGSASASSLAADYAQLCHESCQRLDQCAAMIGKGSDYQALQLAETEPVLLDMVSALSFSGAKDWADFCEANQLSIPEKFDAKAVRQLNTLYAKGIATSHPLYKDYRAAVSSRDDAKALQIVKTIVRLNPGDTNAKSELLRLENKLFQQKLKELRAELEAGNEQAVADGLSELERVASASKLEELPEHPRMVAVRKAVLRREATAQAQELATTLSATVAANDWKLAGQTLSRIAILEREHGFNLAPQFDEPRRAAQSFYEKSQRAAVEAARFGEALRALSERTESADSRFASRAGRKLESVEEDYLALNKCWRDVEHFGRPIPEDLQIQVKRVAAALKSEMDRLKKGRIIRVGGVSVVVLVILACGAGLLWENLQARGNANQLALLLKSRQVQSTEKFVMDIKAQHPRLAAQVVLRAKITEAEAWTRDERKRRGELDAELSELERVATGSFEGVDLAQFSARIASVTKNIEAVATDLKAEPAARLTQIQNKADARLGLARSEVEKALAELLVKTEPVVTTKLSFDNPAEELARGMDEIEPDLNRMAQLCEPGLKSLRPPEALISRVSAIQKRAQTCRTELAAIAKVREQLHGASTLDAYRSALEGYRDSLLVQSEEVKAARRVLVAFPKSDEVLMNLLMPGDPVGWAGLKKDTGRFFPTDVLPTEISKLLALRDDENLRNVWEAAITDHEGSNATRTIYCRSEFPTASDIGLADRTRRSWDGQFYDPKSSPDAALFSRTQINMDIFPAGGKRYQELGTPRRSATSDALRALYLQYMTDEGGTKFQKSILRIFDELVKNKDANPLFKAFAFLRLKEFTMIRPNAWGVQYCPLLRKDCAWIEKAAEEEALRSGDWMVPRRNQQLGAKYAAFFKELGSRAYYSQAKLNHDLIEKCNQAGIRFGGYLDASGKLVLLGEAQGQSDLWVIGANGEPVRLPTAADKQPQATPPLAFSPVFFVLVEREKALAEACKTLNFSPDAPELQAGLPPYFRSNNK